MRALSVNVENMCIFVLTDHDAEVWFIADSYHKPSLDLKRSKIEHNLGGAPSLDLTGAIVMFGTYNADTQSGTPFPPAPSNLAGYYVDRLADLQQIFPGTLLERDWTPGERGRLAPNMAARVFLSGGRLTPKELRTTGGSKSWQIGSKIAQHLVNETEFERPDNPRDLCIIIEGLAGGTRTFRLIPDANGKCTVFLGAYNTAGAATLEEKHGVVFVTEFDAVDKCLDIGSSKMSLPFTYWPDYNRQTDPAGGPCPECVLDLRALPPALVALRMRDLATKG